MKEKNRRRRILFFCFLGALLCLRVIKLDVDVPNWNIAMYTPLDEGPYAMQAIRLARPNLSHMVELLGTKGHEWNSSVSFLLTLFTTVTMKVFGNNYYGLRMGSVIASIFIAVIVLKIIYTYAKEEKGIVLWTGLVLTCNFSFLLSARIVEPSIFRSLLIMLPGAYIFKKEKKDINWWILGILSTICITWGYVTNVFIFVPAVVLLIVEVASKKAVWWKSGLRFFGGCVMAFLGGECCMYLVQQRTFLQDTIRVFGHETKRIALNFNMIAENAKQILASNLFTYNVPLFVLSVLAVTYCLYTGVKERNRAKVWMSMAAFGFFLQGMFTTDFLYRKCVVIFPILIICIAIMIIEMKFFKEHRMKILMLTGLFSLLGMSCAHGRISGLAPEDMTDRTKIYLYCIQGAALLFLFGAVFIKRKSIVLLCLIFAILLPDLYMDYKYIIRAEKTEKESMIELGEIVGEEYVLGYGYSYCLYNNIIPVSNAYDFYFEDEYINRNKLLCSTQKVQYCLGYKGTEYIDQYLEETTFMWEEKQRFYTDFNVLPGADEQYDIYLYEIKEGKD